MKNTAIRLLAALLVLLMLVPAIVSCKKDPGDTDTTVPSTTADPGTDPVVDIDARSTKTAPAAVIPTYTGGDTLAVGYSYFSSKFSPFFSKTAYDQDVSAMTQAGLLINDREGNIILKGIEGQKGTYNGKEYTYNGIADCNIITDADGVKGKMVYEFTLRDDIYFSDGKNLTADDVIFSMYVLSDPTYDGSSSFYSLPITGMEAYRAGIAQIETLIEAISKAGRDNSTYTDFTKENADLYWKTVDEQGALFAQEIVDYCIANYGSYTSMAPYGSKWGAEITAKGSYLAVPFGMAMWGFGSWLSDYVKAADGAYALAADKYVDVYEETTVEADAAFKAKDNKFYKAASATAKALFIIGSTEKVGDADVNVMAAYTGDRYNEVYNGKLEDANGKVWDCTSAATTPTSADYWDNIYKSYSGDVAKINEVESAGSDLEALIANALVEAAYKTGTKFEGESANIAGIEKTGMYSLKITMDKFDAVAIYQLGISVAPMHYYGSEANYKYSENKFGFPKGDLSSIREKTTTPMGAGAYKFVSFKNGIVTFERNEFYYDGCPKIKTVLFRETNDADKLTGVTNGTFDVSDPSFSNAIVAAVKEANDNKALTGNKITTSLVDNLGYGYIGICAKTVNVGGDKSSAASKALRAAFATLFAVYRDTVIDSYYGDRASVIQYPISNTSWAAPKSNDEGFAIAYSKDADGKAIYTATMTEPDKYTAALEAAVGYFKKAGFTYDAATKKFTAAPTGARMTYKAIIPADGIGDHPSYKILTNTKSALETIGITLEIQDPSNSNVLWDALEAGTCDIWAAAWGATIDPDMYQVYHSTSVVGAGGSESNHYFIQDDELDKLILEARESADQAFRKSTYKRCLEIIMEWAVEVPTYQRQNAIIFSTQRVKMATVTPDITTFWGWMNDIEALEMN